MKKTIVCLTAIIIAVACGSNQSGEEKKQAEVAAATPTETTPAYMKDPAYEKGGMLVAQSNCKTCHGKSTSIQGPTYEQLAEKYPSTDANIKMLAQKVIKGGSGVWGQAAMLAHPELTQQQAEDMVRYMLLHKK